MKILYISGPSFLDMDVSFVGSLGKKVECWFLLDLYPKLRKATALNLEAAPGGSDIYPMTEFEGLKPFGAMMDLNRCHVINRTSDNPLDKSNLLLQWKLYRFVRKIAPDIVHFNNQIYFTHFYLFLWPGRKLTSIHDPFPHSGEEHGTKSFSNRLYRWLNKTCVKHHLLYNDIMVDDYAADRKIDKKRIVTSSLGPYEYLKLFKNQSTAIASDFLFFGRIQKYKGIDLLVEAFVQVLKKYPDATLVIAGSGSFWFDVEQYSIPAKNLTIINRFITPSELASLLDGTRVVVCPYRDATQSGVVMSAYAFCKPVIVTDVGALSQVVEDGKTGHVIKPNDAEALAEAMKTFLTVEDSMPQAASQIDVIYFNGEKSWDAITDKILITYGLILEI